MSYSLSVLFVIYLKRSFCEVYRVSGITISIMRVQFAFIFLFSCILLGSSCSRANYTCLPLVHLWTFMRKALTDDIAAFMSSARSTDAVTLMHHMGQSHVERPAETSFCASRRLTA